MDLIAQQKTAFVGIEAEGPRQGIRTLFVPRGEQRDVFRLLCSTAPEAVYFGAGNDRGITDEQADAIIDYIETLDEEAAAVFSILVETTFDQLLGASANAIASLRRVSVPFRCVIVDCCNGVSVCVKTLYVDQLVWHEGGKTYNTRLDDRRYADDVFV